MNLQTSPQGMMMSSSGQIPTSSQPSSQSSGGSGPRPSFQGQQSWAPLRNSNNQNPFIQAAPAFSRGNLANPNLQDHSLGEATPNHHKPDHAEEERSQIPSWMLRRRPHRKDSSVGHPSPRDGRSSEEDDDDNEDHHK